MREPVVGEESLSRNHVRGQHLRHDVPIVQSPLKPLTDPKGWTRTGTIGTQKSRMSHAHNSRAISRDSTIAGHSLRQDVENWDMLPQPLRGGAQSLSRFPQAGLPDLQLSGRYHICDGPLPLFPLSLLATGQQRLDQLPPLLAGEPPGRQQRQHFLMA